MKRLFLILTALALLPLAQAFAEDPTLIPVDPEEPKKIIREISIVVEDIFTKEEATNLVYRTANELKINTRYEVILTELLFKEGDLYDDFTVKESIRNLRNIRFLRDPRIVPTIHGDHVDVEITVRDTWTLIPQLSFSSGTGNDKYAAGLSEGNIAGTGKRLEFLYANDDGRQILETVWEDPRVWGTKNKLLAAYLARSDGQQYVLSAGKPFRGLVEEYAWNTDLNSDDFVGKLFENGTENYIFRQEEVNLGGGYTFATGNPEKRRNRYKFGYNYDDTVFTEATESDYDDINLDPDEVGNELVPDDRRFSGPTFTYQSIEPDYISMNFIDRFSRVSDYNLGINYSATLQVAPDSFGSSDDTLLFGAQISKGWLTSNSSFLRAEFIGSSRATNDGLENSILGLESKWYSVLDHKYWGDLYLGKHTLAARFLTDYSDELDQDKQFRAGAGNSLRGYKARSFNGDKRLILNLEDRFHVIDGIFNMFNLGGVLFFDAGGASYEPFSTLVQDEIYADVGFGFRIGIPVSSGERIVRMDIAFPVRDGPDGTVAWEPRIVFSGGQLFSSRLRSEPSETETVAIGLDR